MDPPHFKFPPASPGTPLFAVSPERVNRTRSPYTSSSSGGRHLAQSPSLPDFGSGSGSPFSKRSHERTDSDAHVQGMVARFNHLELKDHNEQHRRDEIAFKRADMAREMAELDLQKMTEEKEASEKEGKRWREEVRKLRKELEDGRDRERKAMKRLDRSKEVTTHSASAYEKEIRRARKEAFKSSTNLVKTQEELKATRNSLRIIQSGLESEKMKSSKREQEAFTAQYQLVGIQEALEKARDQIKIVEEERDSLKTSLKEEEVARIAAEGRIALPVSTTDEDEEFASPVKSPRKPRVVCATSDSENKENVVPKRAIELKSIQEELTLERRLRERAEDQIVFMKMECQFQCCSCRLAEIHGSSYVHDSTYNSEMERIKAAVPILTPPASNHDSEEMEDVVAGPLHVPEEPVPAVQEPIHLEQQRTATPIEQELEQEAVEEKEESEPQLAFSPTTGTFKPISSEQKEEAPQEASTPAPPKRSHLSNIDETALESSPWGPGPDHSMIRTSTTSPPPFRPTQPISTQFQIPEEVIEDDEDDLPSDPTPSSPPQSEPQTPLRGPSAPATPAYLLRTITTTTTIPLHFSPATPRHHDLPPTPSTISHLPTNATSSQPLQPLELNRLPIDREAALEQIRLRRGRARSLAMGQATPKKQMLEGTGVRRDISAPVGRAGRR
ncbi:uncharacterized protein BDZ99DRAFT_453860 [Mytilinidion resinicola]|uniref:Uncharacterized protein n=1 Tax=Mytilinidion resinicola TaxID=574789 RepID=A0A6A6Y3I8_9PEZI|nr:uncharacterized protein BDZ99DRAFT_453860 [Mytilinidion resinicola]KAF2803093.1 hypothetical protein BDZ99DRAFT_453860 [Mytilinidion resinicola]